jgi:serine O-acetyltransferase
MAGGEPSTANNPGRPFDAAEPLAPVVEALCGAGGGMMEGVHPPHLRREYPSRKAIIGLVEDLRSILFPGFFGPTELTGETLRFHVGSTLDRVLHGLQEQIRRGVCTTCCMEGGADCASCEAEAHGLARTFIGRLPEIRRILATDVAAAYLGDPALTNPLEAVMCYPGVMAITSQRLAHELWLLKVPLIPRIITEHAHSLTGIDIHPGARIGESFFIDHGTGVVIGETTVIGRNVRLYQGVTLGAKSFPLDGQGNPIKGIDRHPVVEDDVVIYSNATILGRVTLGKGSTVGGNVWLTHSLPPWTILTQEQAKT